MTLYLNGHTLRIAHLGPDFLILRHPIEHPAAKAEIALVVDGQEERWPIRLPEGIHTEQKKVAASKV